MIIESKNNRLVKEVKSLEKRKNRQALGLFLVEGINILEEIIDREYTYKYILYSQNMAKLQGGSKLLTRLEQMENVYQVSDEIMKYISGTQTPQGLVGVCPQVDRPLDSLSPSGGTYLYLDRIQDPGNMGTIIRSGDAFALEGLILREGSVDPYNQKVVRSTMGSIFRLPLYWSQDPIEDLKNLKAKGLRLIATSLDTDNYLYDIAYDNSLIIIGNEAQGVDGKILDQVDEKIKIRMPGNSESLNAGVAASIIMYESSKK